MRISEDVEHRFRTKLNTDPGKLNTDFRGSGTSIPDEVEQPLPGIVNARR